MKGKFTVRILSIMLAASLAMTACQAGGTGAPKNETGAVSSTVGINAGGPKDTESQPGADKEGGTDAQTQEGSGAGQENTQAGTAAGQENVRPAEPTTVGALADYLMSAANDYNDKLDKNALMEGQGDASATVTNAGALIMISRAFGTLPAPVGNNARLADKNVSFSDIPEDARDHVDNLIHGGVLVNTQDGKLGAGDPADMNNIKNIVRRIYTLYGTNPKDDFYAAVNKNDLDNKEIPAGTTEVGSTSGLQSEVNAEVRALIQEIAAGSGYEKGSMEQKIKDLYISAVDNEKRNALGVQPLKKYLDALDAATNIGELSDSQILTLKEIGSGGLFSLMYLTDYRDTQKKLPTIMNDFDVLFSKEELTDTQSISTKALREQYETFLVLSGESEDQAKAHVDQYFEFMIKMTDYAPAPEDYANSEKMNKIVTLSQLEALMPGVDVRGMIEAMGWTLPAGDINISSPGTFEGFCELLKDEKYFEAIKTGVKLNLLTANYLNLSDDFRKAMQKYDEMTIGEASDNSSPQEVAAALVENSLGEYIDRLYVEKHFSPEAKAGVEAMAKEFIQVYKERIQKLDWMSQETKEKAIEKLDNMTFLIGYPDEWTDSLKDLEITDNYFMNQVAIAKMKQKAEDAQLQQSGGAKTVGFSIPLTSVNAYYDQYSNTMCFPAAILRSPNYDENAPIEENLAAIGTVIAHEITHAFDDKGARFDKDGLENDWWTPEDYAKFQEKCNAVAAFYDGWESAPGIAISGTQTLGENIADIGAMSCALEVLKKTETPDYDKFFRAYAKAWLKCTSRERMVGLQAADEHSPNNLRVNRVLSNFQEFFDTYGIKEGDGMYVPADERVTIW